MREWLCLALAATSLACSGGRDPVHTVGGSNEDRRPDGAGYTGSPIDNGTSTTSQSTLAALCIKACAHVRAEDCEDTPAHTVDGCEFECVKETKGVSAICMDEAAAVYACTIDAKVTCSGDFVDEAVVDGCEEELSDLQKCVSPGADCAVSPQDEELCISLGFPTFLVCSEGIEPPPECFEVAPNAFCCD